MIKIFSFILLVLNYTTFAQEHNPETEVFERKHSLGITIGHEHVFNGRDANGDPQILILPFWGFRLRTIFHGRLTIPGPLDWVLQRKSVSANKTARQHTG